MVRVTDESQPQVELDPAESAGVPGEALRFDVQLRLPSPSASTFLFSVESLDQGSEEFSWTVPGPAMGQTFNGELRVALPEGANAAPGTYRFRVWAREDVVDGARASTDGIVVIERQPCIRIEKPQFKMTPDGLDVTFSATNCGNVRLKCKVKARLDDEGLDLDVATPEIDIDLGEWDLNIKLKARPSAKLEGRWVAIEVTTEEGGQTSSMRFEVKPRAVVPLKAISGAALVAAVVAAIVLLSRDDDGPPTDGGTGGTGSSSDPELILQFEAFPGSCQAELVWSLVPTFSGRLELLRDGTSILAFEVPSGVRGNTHVDAFREEGTKNLRYELKVLDTSGRTLDSTSRNIRVDCVL